MYMIIKNHIRYVAFPVASVWYKRNELYWWAVYIRNKKTRQNVKEISKC